MQQAFNLALIVVDRFVADADQIAEHVAVGADNDMRTGG